MADMDLRGEQAESESCMFYPTPEDLFSEDDKKWFIERSRKFIYDIIKNRLNALTSYNKEVYNKYIPLFNGVNKKEVKKLLEKINYMYYKFLDNKKSQDITFNEHMNKSLEGRKIINDLLKQIKIPSNKKYKKPKLYDRYEKIIKTIYPNVTKKDMEIFFRVFFTLIIAEVVTPQLSLSLRSGHYGVSCHDTHIFYNKYLEPKNIKHDLIFTNQKGSIFDINIDTWAFHRLIESKTVNDFLFTTLSDGSLTVKDFSYIKELDYVKSILKNTIDTHQKGINIIFYGKPGVGKTELVKTLSKEVGATLYNADTRYNESKKGAANSKLREIDTINEIIHEKNRPMIILDEAEDVFLNSDSGDDISKGTINHILENTKYPIIWTTNSMWIDPSFLRRFTYCICFDDIPRFKQKEIIENIAKKEDIKISDDIITNMIDNKLNFGNVKNILHIAKLNNATEENIINHIEQTARSVRNTYKDFKHKDGNYFNPRLTNTDIDLIRLSEKIKSTGKTNFTICSYGAPGTGKSAYTEYLAELLNMPIIKKKTSDLLSMWVGGTEQNIANAFREAKDSKAILVFDEADSLLQDRRNAHNSWEVTQVNEMLVQMENHPYPFICTTNLFDKLDQASLRRFTFKIEYKYMTDTQIKLAFKHFFNIDTSVDNFHLSTCTAGDFINIKKQIEFLGTNSYNDIIEMLRKEQENKNDDKPNNKMGFC